MAEQVQYMDLFLHGRVKESSIRNSVIEILEERGSVTVGDLGKMLKETTCITNISARLRENFGGLKKFLELDSPALFTVCTNHAFNPHTFLTSTLSDEEKEMIQNGKVPARFTAQNKKVGNFYYI